MDLSQVQMMVLFRLIKLREQTTVFKDKRLEWQQKQEDDKQSQVYVLSKIIHKEVFDIGDTVDIMA